MINNENAGSITQVMTALKELQETIDNAQLRLGNQCVLSRQFLMGRMEIIANALPDVVKKASMIVDAEKDIREAAKRDAAEQGKKAREDAQKIIDDAKRQADEQLAAARKDREEAARAAAEAKRQADSARAQAENDARAIRQQAQQEAQACVARAQQDANGVLAKAQYDAKMMVAQAENAARAAVSQDNVHRMAVVEAEELRDATNQNMQILRQQGVDYVDNILRDADNYLGALMQDIRKQRQALDSRR